MAKAMVPTSLLKGAHTARAQGAAQHRPLVSGTRTQVGSTGLSRSDRRRREARNDDDNTAVWTI